MTWLTRLDKALAGWPDGILTWLLVVLSLGGLLVAWKGKAALKAFLIAYWLLP